MKKFVIIVWSLLLVFAAGFLILPRTILKPQPIHIHAGFQVYKDGELQDFSDFKYMHEMPCTVNGKEVEGDKDEQQEKAHLHDRTGDVVHVHRKGAIWNDLFKNIKYPIDEDDVTAYVDGKKEDSILDKEITPFESVVIFIGKNPEQEKQLKNAVTKERIKQIEDKSENCST